MTITVQAVYTGGVLRPAQPLALAEGESVEVTIASSEVRVANGEWTDEMNRRRGVLLDRKYDHGLSPPEVIELASLQDAMHRYIDRVAPLPLDAARALHQELLQKAAQAQHPNQA